LVPDANITDIDRIDITGDSDNSLTITAADILSMNSENEVLVLGDAGDSVDASGFTQINTTRTIDGEVYDVYGLNDASLLIDQDIAIDVT
jgi:hypothetical protein